MKLVAALLLIAQAALAQDAPLLVREGARVRVTLLARHEERVAGRLLALRPDAILLAADPTEAPRTISRGGIARVEVSAGAHSGAGHGAAVGALVGGISAGVFGAVVGSELSKETSHVDATGGAVTFGLVGAAIGAGLGALIGSGKKERWKEASL